MNRSGRPERVAVRWVLGMLLTAVLFGTTPAIADDAEDNLTVEIIDQDVPGPPVVTPVPPVVPSATPPGRSGATFTPTSSPGVTQQSITDPAAADEALGEHSDTMAGLIYVSMAHATPGLSFHPDGGEVAIVLSIRNVSGETLDGVARFKIATAWGWQASEDLEVAVAALVPGETRVLTATLPGPGQWAFYQTQVSFIPPEKVDNVELAPIVRSENFLVLPLFAAGIVCVLGAAAIGYFWRAKRLSRREVPGE